MKEDKSSEATSGDPDFDLWGLLFQTRDVIYAARGEELRPYGITAMDSAVLFFIDFLGEKATPAEISRWLFRKHHTITGQLSRMEKKGLVTLTKGIIGKNIITICLTDKGREALRHSSDRQSHHRIFSSLNSDERKQLFSTLMKLRKAAIDVLGIEDIHIRPTPPL
ncbi:MarR family winged helix-turn-helix transcriptional regulator [Chloroflexota bacterium]